jgi:hypothetical protein
MRTTIFTGLIGVVLVAAGCISTVDNRKAAGVPFLKDKIQARYERSVDQVAQAAKDVITSMGTLGTESTLYNQSNAVKTIEGKVNQRRVWVRAEGVEPKVTELTVQTRTSAGGADIDLAAQIDKEIALKLAAK